MFNKLYLGELKKLVRPKSLITLSIIMAVLFTFYAIAYNVILEVETSQIAEMEEDMELPEGIEMEIDFGDLLYGNAYNIRTYTESEIDDLIASEKEHLKEIEKNMRENNFLFNLGLDPAYEVRGNIKAFEYIKANKLYNQKIEIHSSTAMFSQKSAEAFAQGFYSILLMIIIIYGIAIGAGSFSSEMKNGTLKMLFMRPITRNKLTTAKILSLLTMITIILLGGTLLSYLYGIIKYGVAPSVKGLIVFNAMSVFEGSKGLVFFMNIMFGLLQAFALCLFAFAFGTVTKNRILAIVTCILTYMGLVSNILSLFKIGKFLFTTNANLGIFFGVTPAIPAGSSFFLALPLFIAYVAIFLASSYIVFNKRDIA